tara:strand:- start:241 stop:561 length:321 start_codon:yes stop_codon:yes gene_type:complete
MKFIKLLILLSGLSIILNNCSSLREAGKVLRNEKTISGDEFLIEKKDPLTLPPDFKKIPEPGSIKNKAESNQNSFEKILKSTKSETQRNQTQSSSVEESILNQIKK